MFESRIFDQIISFPEETQRECVLWLSTSYHSKDTQTKLKELCEENDLEEIIEVFAQLNALYRRNNSARFFEILNEMNVPTQIKSLYVPQEINELRIAYNIRWRIDITVPKASAILINIRKENGEIICFRLDISTFHKFRFNIASVLKELNGMKKSYTRIKKF